MPKFKESFIRMLESHDFEMKKNNAEAVRAGKFVKLVITPTEEGFTAKASAIHSSTEASAESTVMTDAVVDCLTEFEAVATADDQATVDELSDIADDLEDDTGDYGEEDDNDYEDEDYDDEDEDEEDDEL